MIYEPAADIYCIYLLRCHHHIEHLPCSPPHPLTLFTYPLPPYHLHPHIEPIDRWWLLMGMVNADGQDMRAIQCNATQLLLKLNQLSTAVQLAWHIGNYDCTAMPGRRAGSGVGKYNAESPKQDSKRFNCQVGRNTLPIWVWLIYALNQKERLKTSNQLYRTPPMLFLSTFPETT